MSGLSTVISRIRTDLDRGTAYDSRIRQAIDDAIHYYRAIRFGFNSRRTTFTVTSEYTSLTADWLEVDAVALELSTNEVRPLRERPWPWIHNKARDASLSDEPIDFAIQQRQMRLYPPPDQTYSVQMVYLYDLGGVLTDGSGNSLSASDSFSNAWLREGEQMIRLHAQADILINYIKGPEAVADGERCMQMAGALERRLKRRANREQSSGKIEAFL
jgi:hypothetical protein